MRCMRARTAAVGELITTKGSMSAETPYERVAAVLARDRFSEWLGCELEEASEARVVLRLRVRAEMLNGYGITHGAILVAIADSALAFAALARSTPHVTIALSASFLRPALAEQTLRATATIVGLTQRVAFGQVVVMDDSARTLASFQGTAVVPGPPLREPAA
jgi:acyl-CoA thioesterase